MSVSVDDALLCWARWAILSADNGLGFNRTTLLGRVIDLGPTGAAIRPRHGPRMTPGNDTAEAIDAAVAALPGHLRIVVKLEYLGRDSRKQNAKRLHLSYAAFCSPLRVAKARLARGFRRFLS